MKKGKLLLLALTLVLSVGLTACGGDSEKINVYTRDTSSGTREGFFAAIGAADAKGSDTYLVSGVSTASGNGDMINKIKNDEFGIGYISLTSLETSGVKGLTYDGVKASVENVLNDSYKMARTFSYVTIDDKNTESDLSMLVAEFNNYLGSKEGQAVLLDAGVILEQDSTYNYTPGAVCSKSGVNEEVKIGGSTSVEGAAKSVTAALSSKCANFKYSHGHTGSGDSQKVITNDADMQIGFSSSGRRSGWNDKEGVVIGDLGLDAIVVVVNKNNNAISNITGNLLQEIYVKSGVKNKDGENVGTNTKNITKWNEL